jgi:hypothetical protein
MNRANTFAETPMGLYNYLFLYFFHFLNITNCDILKNVQTNPAILIQHDAKIYFIYMIKYKTLSSLKVCTATKLRVESFAMIELRTGEQVFLHTFYLLVCTAKMDNFSLPNKESCPKANHASF